MLLLSGYGPYKRSSQGRFLWATVVARAVSFLLGFWLALSQRRWTLGRLRKFLHLPQLVQKTHCICGVLPRSVCEATTDLSDSEYQHRSDGFPWGFAVLCVLESVNFH